MLALASLATVWAPSAKGQSPVTVQSPTTTVVIQQAYQVALLQDGATGAAALIFVTDSFNADGTTSGTLLANVEGNILQGRFLAVTFGGETLWVAQAYSSDVVFAARGWKTADRLVGESTIALVMNGQVARQNFFLYGQGVNLMVQSPATQQQQAFPQTSALPTASQSAQPNTGPGAPNARP
jgi:hypothetical protein